MALESHGRWPLVGAAAPRIGGERLGSGPAETCRPRTPRPVDQLSIGGGRRGTAHHEPAPRGRQDAAHAPRMSRSRRRDGSRYCCGRRAGVRAARVLATASRRGCRIRPRKFVRTRTVGRSHRNPPRIRFAVPQFRAFWSRRHGGLPRHIDAPGSRGTYATASPHCDSAVAQLRRSRRAAPKGAASRPSCWPQETPGFVAQQKSRPGLLLPPLRACNARWRTRPQAGDSES